MKNYRIGCSGYYYNYWKGNFYPEDLPKKEWLRFYSLVFNAVELNGTFYRVPQLKALHEQAKAVPDHFRFSAKMPRYITQMKKLKEMKNEINGFQDLLLNGLKEKMDCFLFQMPPNFHFNEENLERVISNVPHAPQNVIEFRHGSWWNEATEKALKKAKISFCNVDFPDLEAPFITTSPLFYLRLHGSPQLFRSKYSRKKLEHFFSQFPSRKKAYHVYFNNTDELWAYKNALELMEIIRSA